MKVRQQKQARLGLFILTFVWLGIIVPISAMAAPYAAMVMDARTGKVLHARNADTRLHPASLTKMMTLYIAFEAVERGEISLDTMVRISRNAAAEPPSKLGLKAGQRIKLRYLIRAAAIKSANDAATAIGEAISGSEAAFARRMNRTARALGMTRTTFKNAHGLTESGHMSTARDMTILGRHILFDYSEYYNLFSRRTANAGIKSVPNTNRRLLDAYEGADGIKTGYTRAAGFNLVASAKRGNERVIATVFGGRSTASRNAKVAELLDLGFRRAPSRVTTRAPEPPVYAGNAASPSSGNRGGKSVRVNGLVSKSLRPNARPTQNAPAEVLVAGTDMRDDIAAALTQAGAGTPPARVAPTARPETIVTASTGNQATSPSSTGGEVVTRLANVGGMHWGINVGKYPNRFSAERMLLKTALAEMATLDGSRRRVIRRQGGFDAVFTGMSRDTADRACRRLQAQNVTCFMIGPG